MSPTVLSLWKTPLRGILKHRQADQHIRQKIRGGFFRKGSWIMFRGLKFHVWEYEDNGWGAETNIYAAGRSEDIDGDYEEKISAEILSWPDMINN